MFVDVYVGRQALYYVAVADVGEDLGEGLEDLVVVEAPADCPLAPFEAEACATQVGSRRRRGRGVAKGRPLNEEGIAEVH